METQMRIQAWIASKDGAVLARRFKASWYEVPEKVALLMDKGSPYYLVTVDGTSEFDLIRENGELHLLSCDYHEGFIRQKDNYRWEVRLWGFEGYHGDYDSLEDAIRSFNYYWRRH